METTKVLTSLLVLTLTGPTLGYPYTRGVVSRGSGRARDHQVMDSNLEDYLGGYVQDQQYGLPEYQPSYRHEYAPQRQRISAEAIAALLPYLTNTNDDYAYDYNTYSDDDGTWYDDTASDDFNRVSDSDNAALLQFLLDHRSGRYSLEDLETLEREAEMEDNTENQLHALMAKKINKKSNMPLLGARQPAVASPIFGRQQGQKEEAVDIPSTKIRRPVFASQIITSEPEETKPQAKRNTETSSVDTSSDSSSTSQQASSDVSGQAAPVSSDSSSSAASSSSRVVPQSSMTPFIHSKYDDLMKYLDRERKVRQNQDIEQELQQETLRPQPQKRFVTEQDALSQQLANLKKPVA